MYWILIIVMYFLLKRLWKILELNFEKLEEFEGEFIYTYLKGLLKKEAYFNLKEVKYVFFSVLLIKNDIVLKIILKDGYTIILRKRKNCILFLKSCKENNEELYMKILQKFPMGLDISQIIEREIEKYKEDNEDDNRGNPSEGGKNEDSGK